MIPVQGKVKMSYCDDTCAGEGELFDDTCTGKVKMSYLMIPVQGRGRGVI